MNVARSRRRLGALLRALAAASLLSPAALAALPTLSLNSRPLGTAAKVEVVPAQPREDAPDFFPPASLRATFDRPDTELRVYPVAGLLKQYPERTRGSVYTEVGALKALLRERPAPTALKGPLPYLPTAFADQVVYGAVKYVDFAGGRGVRYLVGYSQEAAPLTRAQVFYTFQGLTHDGKYYVSFDAPVTVKTLPADLQNPTGELKTLFDKLMAGAPDANAAFDAYRRKTARQLDTLMNDTQLTRLDTVVRSVQVRD